MKFTFVSNYINHHQIPIADLLYGKLGEDYCFIQTEQMEQERAQMGWNVKRDLLPYLKCWYEEPDVCGKLVRESEIVVFGGVEDERYIEERLRLGRPVIRYSERLYREGQWKAVSPRGLLKKYRDHTRYRKKNVWLLCSGAYVASDFHIVRAYPDRMYQWGYFTETRYYEMEELMSGKPGASGKPVELLFAGRFLPLKHPEYPLMLAQRLQEKGLPFHLTMIGGGELDESLRAQVRENGLQEKVTFTGYQNPSEVRGYMEQADIFLMTSNYLEGWGAVINEAMNSGCAVIADAKIGAVPFLLKHEKNGMVYADKNLREFLEYGERLVRDRELCRRLGREAYDTIVRLWNPQFAAESLLKFAEGILAGKPCYNREGPLSKAAVISPRAGYAYTRAEKSNRWSEDKTGSGKVER